MKRVIDYEPLVARYLEDLNTMLRGFGRDQENEFLETWVPDDDVLRSILGLLEAASEAGIPSLTVRIGPNTLAALDVAALNAAASKLGVVEFHVEQEVGYLSLDFQTSKAFADVHPAYREALQRLPLTHDYEGTLLPEPSLTLAQARDEGLKLAALVDAAHVIRKARHSGPCTPTEDRLLEATCRIIESKPVLECGDHAIIQLEHELRDHSQLPPVPGVVMADSSHPMFAKPLRLVRTLVADYRRQASYHATDNFYIKPCSPRWQSLLGDERLLEVANAIRTFSNGDLVLTAIEGDRRVVIHIADSVSGSDTGHRLLRLEQHLRHTVEPTLEVHLQAKADQNVIRKIKEVKG